MRDRPELASDELDLASVMHALADPSRLRMVAALEGGEELACAVLGDQAGFKMAKSTTTHHLSVLRDAGIIRTRQDGQRRLATLRRAEVDQKFPGLLEAVLRGMDTSL
jgi:DNA-binding transcriptional ArsR family regulator